MLTWSSRHEAVECIGKDEEEAFPTAATPGNIVDREMSHEMSQHVTGERKERLKHTTR
jgi:hypothetical protein